MPIITLNTGFPTYWQVNTYSLQNTFKEERKRGEGKETDWLI